LTGKEEREKSDSERGCRERWLTEEIRMRGRYEDVENLVE